MKTTKTKTKTVLTIETSSAELYSMLLGYQKDILQEMIVEMYRPENGKISSKDAVDFVLMAMGGSSNFAHWIEECAVMWVPTPKTNAEWADLVESHPFLFGITDDVVTSDVENVILYLNGVRYDVSGGLVKNF